MWKAGDADCNETVLFNSETGSGPERQGDERVNRLVDTGTGERSAGSDPLTTGHLQGPSPPSGSAGGMRSPA